MCIVVNLAPIVATFMQIKAYSVLLFFLLPVQILFVVRFFESLPQHFQLLVLINPCHGEKQTLFSPQAVVIICLHVSPTRLSSLDLMTSLAQCLTDNL